MPKPTPEQVALVESESHRKANGDKQIQQNHLFSAIFSRETGLYSDTNCRLSRRKWIENYFVVIDKKGRLTPLRLNRAQRKLESWILRMERANLPVRIGILKSRQQGMSSYIQAVMFETILRGEHKRGLICADTKDRSELLLRIANTARHKMPKNKGDNAEPWDLKMSSKAKYVIGWAPPIDGLIEITSSEVDRPGMSGTRGFVHLSESAFYVDPEEKYPAILASLPSEPWTYGFDESTANGDVGMFRDAWIQGWQEDGVPLRKRRNQWVSLFFGWHEHEEYRYSKTYGGGQMPDPDLVAEIEATLDEDERWLLEQKYWVRGEPGMEWEEVPCVLDRPGRPEHGAWGTKWRLRGCGWTKVNIDQLAWRRAKLNDKELHGDINKLHSEYPATHREAFVSTGNSVFPPDVLERYGRKVTEPIWSGSLEEPEVPRATEIGNSAR